MPILAIPCLNTHPGSFHHEKLSLLITKKRSELQQRITDLSTSQEPLFDQEYAFTILDQECHQLSQTLLEELGSPAFFEKWGLSGEIEQFQKEIFDKLSPLRDLFSQKQQEILNQRKWLELGLPKEALSIAADCVEFLVTSKMHLRIQTFINTTSQGKSRHSLQFDKDSLYLKFQGDWKPWSEIKNLIRYDISSNKVVSSSDPSEQWNYISPEGFVKKEPDPLECYPIDALDRTEYEALLTHATTYWQSHPEYDIGKEKPCIFQIVTSEQDQKCSHTSLRLVDDQGRLYSFGIELTQESLEHFNSPFRLVATGYSRVYMPDFAESSIFSKRFVTSIPITRDRLTSIVHFVNATNNAPGMRFCLTKQNCTTFAVACAQIAGLSLDTRTTFDELLLQNIPFGPQILKIHNLARSLIHLLPKPITQFIHTLTRPTLGEKLHTLFFNTLLLTLGAARQVAPVKTSPIKGPFRDITRLISSFSDLFDPDKLQLDHSYKITQWQKETSSTIVYEYSGNPKIYALPEN